VIKTKFHYLLSCCAVIIFLFAILFTLTHVNTPSEVPATTIESDPTLSLPDADWHIAFLEHDFGYSDPDFLFNTSKSKGYLQCGNGYLYRDTLESPIQRTRFLSESDSIHYGLYKQGNKQLALFEVSEISEESLEPLIHLILCYRDYFSTVVVGNIDAKSVNLLCKVVGLKVIYQKNYTILYQNISPVNLDEDCKSDVFSFNTASTHYTLDLNKPMIALTYDDGPNENTNTVIQALKKHRAKATFYVIGAQIDQYPETIAAIFDASCEIGNHSNLHEIFSDNTPSIIQKTVDDTNEKLRLILSIGAATVRPPTGATNDRNGASLVLGYPIILWSIDTRDYTDTATPESIHNAVFSALSDGDIVLMHDIHKMTADSTDFILDTLTQNGYQAVTVSELLEFRSGGTVADKLYHHAES